MSLRIGESFNLNELMQKADAGDPEAMFDIVCAVDINGLAKDDPQGEIASRRLSYMRQLSQIEGYENIYITLGDTFYYGKGVEPDAQEAIRWYEKAVAAGIPFGNECIGMMYYAGNGVPVDYEKAFLYFTKNGSDVSFCTLYALGEMYRQGLFVEKDLEAARDYYEEIVYSDSKFKKLDDYYWRACYRLGRAYHYGWGTEEDIDEALALLSNAKRLFDNRSEYAADIAKEEIYNEWNKVNRDAGIHQ